MARKVHHQGTATWFTQRNDFSDWKSTGSLMWIHGLRSCMIFMSFATLIFSSIVSWIWEKCPLVCVTTSNLCSGALTNFISSTIIEDVETMCRMGLATLSFFYFDFRDAGKQDARSLLSSLLIQFCHQSDKFSEMITSLYSTNGNGTRQPSEDALMECLKGMLKLPEQGDLYVVVDALDECSNSSGYPTPREQVLKIIQELVGLCLSHVHFCITSRPEVDIRDALEALAVHNVSLHEQAGQNQDISDYIESVVSSDLNMRRWREEDRQLVTTTLMKRARGM